MTSKRIYYIDKIKVLLCLMVISIHASVCYGGSGSWYYTERTNSMTAKVVFTIFNAIVQSFSMGFFFFISAYFTPRSFNKKGTLKFLKDRFLRLGIPVIIFYFILNPTISYTLLTIIYKKNLSYLSFLYHSISNLKNLGFGPLWFVTALLIFSLFYVGIKNLFKNKISIPFPNNKIIFSFIIFLGLLSFFTRLVCPTGVEILGMQLGYFPQYTFLFTLGIIAYENNWLNEIKSSCANLWFNIAIASIFILVITLLLGANSNSVDAFLGGLHWQSFIYAAWEQFMCVGVCLKFITSFRDKFDTYSSFWSSMALSSYPVYIIHAPISVLIECLIIGFAVHPFIKFLIVVTSVSVICFSLSHYVLRRLPLLKKIL